MGLVESPVSRKERSTLQVKKRSGPYSRARVEGGDRGVVSQTMSVLLAETVRKFGLGTTIPTMLASWRKPRAAYGPGKLLMDVALPLALGGDCLADVGMLRAEPSLFGPVVSDPTVPSDRRSRRVRAGPSQRSARRGPKCAGGSGKLARASSAAAGRQLIVDIDGALAPLYSEMQTATALWKKTFGHHPLVAFVDRGQNGSANTAAAPLRPVNADSNSAIGYVETAQLALDQLPNRLQQGRQTLIHTDSASGTPTVLDRLSRPGRRLSHFVGATITEAVHQAVLKIPKKTWTLACDGGGTEQQGAWVAEITDTPGLTSWPERLQLIACQERPCLCGQLRFTDLDRHRLSCFATNAKGGQLAVLELTRNTRAAGLPHLPPHDKPRTGLGLSSSPSPSALHAWMPMLALPGGHRGWEPQRPRLRLFSAAAQFMKTAPAIGCACSPDDHGCP
jgi:hypothetical protein